MFEKKLRTWKHHVSNTLKPKYFAGTAQRMIHWHDHPGFSMGQAFKTKPSTKPRSSAANILDVASKIDHNARFPLHCSAAHRQQ